LAAAVAELEAQREDRGELLARGRVLTLRCVDHGELVAGLAASIAELAVQREDGGELLARGRVLALHLVDHGELVARGGFAAAVAELAAQREDGCELLARSPVFTLQPVDHGKCVACTDLPPAITKIAERSRAGMLGTAAPGLQKSCSRALSTLDRIGGERGRKPRRRRSGLAQAEPGRALSGVGRARYEGCAATASRGRLALASR
jgi:hypothetical protein